MRGHLVFGGLGLLIAAAGCERIVAEPPPPPSRADVLPAAPGALGARAAGTDMAPKPPGWPVPPPSAEGDEDPEEEAEPPGSDGSASPAPPKAVPL